MIKILIAAFMLSGFWSAAQETSEMALDTLPYYTIPDYPESHSSALILARMIDGLGFRYHWATEGLRPADLDYEAGNESRSTRDVLEHLYSLSVMIKNTVLGDPNVRPKKEVDFTDDEIRSITLVTIQAAADYLRQHPDIDLEQRPITFQRGEKVSEVPFWHLLNGPLADAIWHCGQIVGNRRASGNPIPAGVNVFKGTKN